MPMFTSEAVNLEVAEALEMKMCFILLHILLLYYIVFMEKGGGLW